MRRCPVSHLLSVYEFTLLCIHTYVERRCARIVERRSDSMLDEVFFLPRDEKGEVKEAPGAPPDEAAGEAQKARISCRRHTT